VFEEVEDCVESGRVDVDDVAIGEDGEITWTLGYKILPSYGTA
jgi:hypothetical protein